MAVGDRNMGERRVKRRAGVDTFRDAHDVIVDQRHGFENAAASKLLVAFRSVGGDRGESRIHFER